MFKFNTVAYVCVWTAPADTLTCTGYKDATGGCEGQRKWRQR